MRPGEVVAGRFHVEARAGEGGMAVVYRARDVLTGQPVALKVLRDEAGVDAERFVREAVLLAGLSHPAIVRYIAHGTLGTRPSEIATDSTFTCWRWSGSRRTASFSVVTGRASIS